MSEPGTFSKTKQGCNPFGGDVRFHHVAKYTKRRITDLCDVRLMTDSNGSPHLSRSVRVFYVLMI